MQHTIDWWSTLSDLARREILAEAPGPYQEWVLDSMAVAGIVLVDADVGGAAVRLPPTATTDFLKRRVHALRAKARRFAVVGGDGS